MTRIVTELADEGPLLTPLRVLAHLEAGDDVEYQGDMTAEPWWPDIEPAVSRILWERTRQAES